MTTTRPLRIYQVVRNWGVAAWYLANGLGRRGCLFLGVFRFSSGDAGCRVSHSGELEHSCGDLANW